MTNLSMADRHLQQTARLSPAILSAAAVALLVLGEPMPSSAMIYDLNDELDSHAGWMSTRNSPGDRKPFSRPEMSERDSFGRDVSHLSAGRLAWNGDERSSGRHDSLFVPSGPSRLDHRGGDLGNVFGRKVDSVFDTHSTGGFERIAWRERHAGESDVRSNPYSGLGDRHGSASLRVYLNDHHGGKEFQWGTSSPVPVPGAAVLFATGVAGLVGRAARRWARS